MSNNPQIPGADLPLATPGATDTVVGVDQSTGALRRFRRDSFPLSAADQARLQALETGRSAGMLGFATKAAMDASLAHPEGTLALVTNDATAANNGAYRKVGASGAGSWMQSADRVTGLEQSMPKKADLVIGKNLFNPAAATAGYAVDVNGNLFSASGFYASAYIPVDAGQQYSISARRQSAWYDANRAFLAQFGGTAVPVTVTAPAGAKFLRTSVYMTEYPTYQVEMGASNTAYEPYEATVEQPPARGGVTSERLAPGAVTGDKLAADAVTAGKIAASAVTGDKLAAGAVTPGKTSFMALGKNLFDKSAVTVGSYLSHTNVPTNNATYDYSDFIAVTPGQTYTGQEPARGAASMRFTTYFDANKNYVAGGSSVSVGSITVPAGVHFVRVTVYHDQIGNFQFELGAATTPYEAYGYKVGSNYFPNAAAPELVVPPYLFGVQGREMNVYTDNLHVSTASDYFHNIDTSGSYGQQQSERFTWTPAGEVTTGTLSVTVHDKRSGTALVSKTAQLRAAGASAGSGTTKKVLVIGDSLINAGIITQTMLDIVSGGDVMGLTLLGTRGTAPNKHEGRGGWTVATYTTNYSDGPYGANPFWKSGAVNFGQYLTDNAIATPDWVFIHLGINDCFTQTDDAACSALADSTFISLDVLISSIKAAGANVKVGLLIPTPPSSDQDAFGASYGTGQTRFRFKRNILIWARQLCAKYNGQEANRIYVVPTNTAYDTVNNSSRAASAPINSRTASTGQRQNNGVHPATEGYRQIGDALWAFLKCNVSA